MNAGAKQALLSTVTGALPELLLTGTLSGNADQWLVQRSLLNSGPTDLGVVVEVEADGTATLRFGDGLYGRRPATDTEFDAIYRVGNGSAGNIGTDALVHVVGADVSLITQVRNPLPAVNGVDPESAESVRRRAPEAFRIQERALTPADYVEVTERRAGVQRAASRMRWTGSWHTVFVTVDQPGGAALDADARAEMTSYLDRFRMAGHDVAFEEPTHVSLDIALHVCVQSDYFRADVRRALLDLFSNRLLPDGRRGLFHPDNFSFGEPVYLSPLLAAAHRVPGVASVEARRFGRKGDDDPQPLADGRVLLGPREIARLDNDPNFREHGVLTLELHGGK
jgi:predicted phage baseplate assembly protein